LRQTALAIAAAFRDDGFAAYHNISHQGVRSVTANRFLNPPTIAPPRGYTHVVETTGPGRTIYVAGQLGLDPGGTMAEGFRAQTTQAFENVKAALAAVGADWSHVVKITSYFVDMGDLPAYFEVRNTFVNTASPPASTAVQISQLARPGALFEVEAIAVVPA
jgi:enamine deaminase RidA (YjgF/YER057c/UK114 family)